MAEPSDVEFILTGPAAGTLGAGQTGTVGGEKIGPGYLEFVSGVIQQALDSTYTAEGQACLQVAIQRGVGDAWAVERQLWRSAAYPSSDSSASLYPKFHLKREEYLVGRLWHRDDLSKVLRCRVIGRVVV